MRSLRVQPATGGTPYLTRCTRPCSTTTRPLPVSVGAGASVVRRRVCESERGLRVGRDRHERSFR